MEISIWTGKGVITTSTNPYITAFPPQIYDIHIRLASIAPGCRSVGKLKVSVVLYSVCDAWIASCFEGVGPASSSAGVVHLVLSGSHARDQTVNTLVISRYYALTW